MIIIRKAEELELNQSYIKVKLVWTVFEKFEIRIKRSGEKRYECISSGQFFPTP